MISCCWSNRTGHCGTATSSEKGSALVERALSSKRIGPYTLQAAIAAVHAEAPSAGETDWAQIVALYDLLLRAEPSPIIELNRAVAVAMRDGPAKGLELVDALLERGELAQYHLAHAHGPTSVEDWIGRSMPASRTNVRWPSRSKNRNEGFWRSGSRNYSLGHKHSLDLQSEGNCP